MKEHNGNDETSCESFRRGMKTLMFKTYYNLLESQFRMKSFYILILTLEAMQITGLTIFNTVYSNTQSQVEDYSQISIMIDVFRIVYTFYPAGNYLCACLLSYVLLAVLIVFLILFLYFKTHNFDTKNPKRGLWRSLLMKTALLLNILFQRVFMIPIYVTLLSFLECNSQSQLINFPSYSCGSIQYYVNCVISSINLTFFTLLSVMNCIFLNDNRPISKLPWAGPFSYINFFPLILKFVLCFFYVFKFSSSSDIKVILVISLSIVFIALRFFNQFFHMKIVGYFTILYEMSFLFNSLFGLVNKYMAIRYNLETVIVQVLTSLLFGVVIVAVIEKRNEGFIYKNSESYRNPRVAFNKLMVIFEFAREFKENSFKRSIFISILQKHRLKCVIPNCKCHTYIKIINENVVMDKSTAVSLKSVMNEALKCERAKIKKLVLDGTHLEPLKGKEESFPDGINESSVIQTEIKKNIPTTIEGNTSISKLDEENNLFNLRAHEEKLILDDCIFGVVRLVLDSLIVAFPKNVQLKLIYSYLMTYYLGNIYKALFELMSISKRTLSLQTEFEVFIAHCEIEKKMYTDSLDLQDAKEDISMEHVLDFNNITNKILDLINVTSREVIHFWKEILGFTAYLKYMGDLGTHPSELRGNPYKKKGKREVYEYAITISKNINSLSEMYKLLIDNDKFRNKSIFKLYAEFLKKVICNEQEAEAIKEHINSYDKIADSPFAKKDPDKFGFSEGYINMDEVGTVVISGDLSSIGKILHCNLQFCSIFKYKKEVLMKYTINHICPSYFAEYHNEFIIRYLETGRKHVLNKSIIIFGLSSQGLIVPFIILVKVIPNLEQSIRFIGLVKKLSKSHHFLKPPIDNPFCEVSDDVSLVFCNHQDMVFGITKKTLKTFGIPLNVLMMDSNKISSSETKILDIKNLFPDTNFEDKEIFHKMKSEHGCLLKLDSKILKNFFEDFRESLESGKTEILKSLHKFNPSKIFHEHSVLVFLYELYFNEGHLQAKIYKLIKVNSILPTILMKQNSSSYFHNLPKDTHIEESKKPKSIEGTTIKKSSKMFNPNATKAMLDRFKHSLTSFSLPSQVRKFIIIVSLFLFLLCLIGLAEFLFSWNFTKNVNDFIEMYGYSNQRNIYFSLIILYFKALVLMDNHIVPPAEALPRELVISKMKRDLNIIFDLNNQLILYLGNANEEIYSLHQKQDLITKNLNEDFTFYSSQEKFAFLVNYILVKIDFMLSRADHLTFTMEKQEDLFYYNSHFAKSPKSSEILREIFYVIENATGVVRYYTEKAIILMKNQLKDDNLFNSQIRNYICYTPFGLIVISFVIFSIILTKISDYKIRILKVFFYIDKKYGYEIIKRCNAFLEYTSNFTKYTKMDPEKVMEEMLAKEKEREEKEKITSQNQDDSIHSPNSKIGPRRLLSLSKRSFESTVFVSKAVQAKKEKKLSGDSARPTGKNLQFWEKEEKEKQENAEEKEEEQKVSSELDASKANLKKSFYIIFIEVAILMTLIAIYFIVTLSFNLSFDKGLGSQVEKFYFFSNRGWIFNNFLIYYREMIMQNTNTSVILDYKNSTNLYTVEDLKAYDLFNLYSNQSYYIENSILLLTNSFSSEASDAALVNTVALEKELNGENYCTLLKNFDSSFYQTFQQECEEFYKTNLGLKDNIKIISGYIQAHFPDFAGKSLISQCSLLANNWTFIDGTEIFINQAILFEIDTLQTGIKTYISKNFATAIIRISIYIILLLSEFAAFLYITSYLSDMLNKDKAILNIIPNEVIQSSKKVKFELSNLRTFK